jgi:hypothetical protein
MKKLTLLALLALASCGPQYRTQNISVSRFFPFITDDQGNSCIAEFSAGSTVIFSSGGMLDVAAGNPQFFLAAELNVTAPINQNPVTAGGVILEQANRNRPLLQQTVITYRTTKKVVGTIKPFTYNQNVTFSSAGAAIVSLQLISPEFGTQLFDALAASATMDDVADVQVDVEFKGIMSATRDPFSTGIATYPIKVFRSLPQTVAGGTATPLVCDAGKQFRHFDLVAVMGNPVGPNFCKYIGQSASAIIAPAPLVATDCCAIGTPGC